MELEARLVLAVKKGQGIGEEGIQKAGEAPWQREDQKAQALQRQRLHGNKDVYLHNNTYSLMSHVLG